MALPPRTSPRTRWQGAPDEPEADEKPTRGFSDPVTAALAHALTEAAKAGRFDVVAQLARELEARRLEGSNVATIDAEARKRGRR